MKIKLTPRQIKELQPLFKEVHKKKNYGKCALFAQVYQTNGGDYEMDVRFLDAYYSNEVREILTYLPQPGTTA